MWSVIKGGKVENNDTVQTVKRSITGFESRSVKQIVCFSGLRPVNNSKNSETLLTTQKRVLLVNAGPFTIHCFHYYGLLLPAKFWFCAAITVCQKQKDFETLSWKYNRGFLLEYCCEDRVRRRFSTTRSGFFLVYLWNPNRKAGTANVPGCPPRRLRLPLHGQGQRVLLRKQLVTSQTESCLCIVYVLWLLVSRRR